MKETKNSDTSLALLQAILEATSDGVITVDKHQIVVHYNQNFHKIWALPKDWTQIPSLEDRLALMRPRIKEPDAVFAQIKALYAELEATSCAMIELEDGRIFERVATPYYVNGEVEGKVWRFRDITARERAKATLREREKEYRRLLDALQEGIWVIDQNSLTTFVNPRMAEMLGYTQEDMLGKHLFDFMDQHGVENATQKLTRRRHGIKEQHEFELQHKDGRTIYTLMDTSPILDDDGNYDGAIAGVTDITDRKQAEEQMRKALREKEVLLQELYHRVNNNLTIVSSLLDFQAEATDDDRVRHAFQDSQNRIYALARVQEHLYGSEDLAWINMAEYVQSLVDRLRQTYQAYQTTITIEITDTMLHLDQASPCGLIVNELVSNAMEHAFRDETPRDGANQIRVTFQTQATHHILTISDNGIGLAPDVNVQDPATLGLRLVRLLTQQLEGTIARHEGIGTTISITFPRAD